MCCIKESACPTFNFPAFLTISAVHDGDEQIMNDVAGFTNISDQLQYEKRLSQLELRDGPTGLANRNLLTGRTNQALLQAERYGRRIGMLCICLDGFNEVNNIHAGDDELLKLVAQQLVASVRATDTVARITANEFVVLLPEIEDADHVLLVAAKIAKSLDELSTLNVGT